MRNRKLKDFEVHTIFGTDNSRTWKCILFSDLTTVEVYTIFVTENHGLMSYTSHVRRSSVRGPGGEAPLESRGVWGGASPPNERDGRGGVAVNGFWGMVPSRGTVKVGLIRRFNERSFAQDCLINRQQNSRSNCTAASCTTRSISA